MLSICIPTRNRSGYLEKTLESITSESIFLETDKIEVAISDNASTDDTRAVAEHYAEKFLGKIVYSRNETDIGDRNFIRALSLGSKQLLKLHNDNHCMAPGALAQIVSHVESLQSEKPQLLFRNGDIPGKSQLLLLKDRDQFFAIGSHYITWIGAHAVWREDLEIYKSAAKKSQFSQLGHVLGLFELARKKSIFAIYNDFFVVPQLFHKTFDYNEAEIFGMQFGSILKYYRNQNIISQKTYAEIKRSVFLRHIVPVYFGLSANYKSRHGGFWRFLKDYHHDWYFYPTILPAFLVSRLPEKARLGIASLFKRIIAKLGKKRRFIKSM